MGSLASKDCELFMVVMIIDEMEETPSGGLYA